MQIDKEKEGTGIARFPPTWGIKIRMMIKSNREGFLRECHLSSSFAHWGSSSFFWREAMPTMVFNVRSTTYEKTVTVGEGVLERGRTTTGNNPILVDIQYLSFLNVNSFRRCVHVAFKKW